MDNYFWKNLKHLREGKKFSQRRLGEILKVPQRYISEWEKGKRDVSLTKLIRMARIFNVTLNTLVTINLLDEKNPNITRTQTVITLKVPEIEHEFIDNEYYVYIKSRKHIGIGADTLKEAQEVFWEFIYAHFKDLEINKNRLAKHLQQDLVFLREYFQYYEKIEEVKV